MGTLPKIAGLLLTGFLLTALSGCMGGGPTLASVEYELERSRLELEKVEREIARGQYEHAQEMRRKLEQASSVEEIDGIMVQAASDRVARILSNEGYAALHTLADQKKKVLRRKTTQ